ncbi:MAG TPA: NAD(P)-dependent alcohol dehydrogenase, partial [Polyangia bacterium]
MTRVHAFAALAPRAPLVPYAYDATPLGDGELELEVTHCGLCHSDVHLIDDAWHRSVFPLVPGHEIIGRVVDAGAAVSELAIGQRVGVGWQRTACLGCDACKCGRENLCPLQEATCIGHHGGLAERVRVDASFAFAVPDAIESADAAPLLCGGVTVFAPLLRFGAGVGRVVGVIGVGGLGHLAVRFAAALGCEVVAFSSSPDKDAAIRAMGANEVVRSTEPRALRAQAGRIDLLIATAPAQLDWIAYVQALRAGGVLCLVGAAPDLVRVPAAQLLTGQKAICGSDIGDRRTMRAMLAFAAGHGVRPTI